MTCKMINPWWTGVETSTWTGCTTAVVDVQLGSRRAGVVVERGLDSDRTTTRDLDATQAPHRIGHTWFANGRCRIIQLTGIIFVTRTKYGYSG